jgi:hypothetical protein
VRAATAAPLLVLGLAGRPAEAHRIDIDLLPLPDGRIRAEVYYSDGKAAAGAEVVVQGAGGREVARGTADGQGAFEFRAPPGEPISVVARHEGGHRAVKAWDPAGPLPERRSAAERGAIPFGKLLLGICLIAALGFILQRALRGRRAS